MSEMMDTDAVFETRFEMAVASPSAAKDTYKTVGGVLAEGTPLKLGLSRELVSSCPTSCNSEVPELASVDVIDVQHHCGIRLNLVREHDLQDEAGLLEDIGIYGNGATGRQEFDDASRTIRFTFDFGPQNIQSVLVRWERLLVREAVFGCDTV